MAQVTMRSPSGERRHNTYMTNYREAIKPSSIEAGNRMGAGGHYLVLTPAEEMERLLVEAVRKRYRWRQGDFGLTVGGVPVRRVSNRDRGELDGRILALAQALVLVQAGSSWVNGRPEQDLIVEIEADLYASEGGS